MRVLAIVFLLCSCTDGIQEEQLPREELINKAFSNMDGSHLDLRRIVVESQNNGSFDHIQTN